jgi:hypothetical protein
MPRELADIVADLKALDGAAFDDMNTEARGAERLYALCQEVLTLAKPPLAFPEFFALIERCSESELGTPGPLVHTMESYVGTYEQLLVDSIKRKPTDLTVWMVNRILNGPDKEKKFWMDVLLFAAEHPNATALVKQQASHFIAIQKKK